MPYQRKDRPRTVDCAVCGRSVPVAYTGPLPMYCSASHKQAAYQARRDAERLAELAGLRAALERCAS